MTEAEQYDLYADEMRREAQASPLANVRERCLRSEEAWRLIAARSRRTGEQRSRNAAERAAAVGETQQDPRA